MGRRAAPTGQGESALFEQNIRPLLESKCLRCHDAKVRKADLDLSTHASILKGGESGPVVVPGKPDESPLYEMVRDGLMPADKKNKLTPEQVESLRRWIEAGAPAGPTATPVARVRSRPRVTQHDVYPILLRRCIVCHGRDVRRGASTCAPAPRCSRGGSRGRRSCRRGRKRACCSKKIRAGAMPPRRGSSR